MAGYSVANISSQDDPQIVVECKRKKPYPTRAMAETARLQKIAAGEATELNVYPCRHGDHFHIGKPSNKPQEQRNMKARGFVERDGIMLARYKFQTDQWIVMLPKGVSHTDDEVMIHGRVVACQGIGDRFFLTKHGVKAKYWKHYKDMLYVYPYDGLRFKEWAKEQELHFYDDILPQVKAEGFVTRNPPQLSAVPKIVPSRQEQQRQIEQQEMYLGRAVFRTPDDKPFYRDIVTCSTEGCNETIELRAFIATDNDGNLGTIYKKTPLDGKAILKEGSSKQSGDEWICKECAKDHKHHEAEHRVDIVEPEQKHKQLPVAGLSTQHILLDLQMIAADNAYDAEFVRGATLMACYLLNGKAA